MIKAVNLVKNYGDFHLDVSFEIPDGTVTGIVGKNGAGKSTTIKAILGLIRPDGGSVTINGLQPSMLTAKEKSAIGTALSDSGFSSYLRVEDVICILRKTYPTFDETFFRNNCISQGLPFDKRIQDFSTGMRAKLRVLTAISHKADILIMDEPTAGLDVGARGEILDLLRQFLLENSDCSVDIQGYTEKSLNVKLNSSFYLSLLDHIYIAVQRNKKGIGLSSTLTTEIELYYEDIYKVAKQIVKMMEAHFSVEFDQSEVYFISVHLLESVLHLNYSEISEKVEEIIELIENMVWDGFGDRIDKNSIDYTRFMVHSKRFANMVTTGKISNTSDTKMDDIYQPLKKTYKKQYETVERIIQKISSQYKCKVGTNEKFYLFIHVVKISGIC